MAFHRVIMKRVAPFMMSLIILVIFIVLWDEVVNWSISLSIIVWLSGTFIIMQKSIADALSFYVQTTKRFVSIEKLWDFFDATPQIQGYKEWKTFKHKSWEVSLKNVSYGYDESKPIFENFSLDIPGNQITALVWPSGGGKSTLVKLISGYIRQDWWDILVDNQNLREVSLKSYYSDVGYLTQEPSVFDGTVEENLLYAVTKKISKKKIDETIKLAHCEFIYDLPNGLQTEIGERWVKLSWGQKQRLAIAKIFLKNPKIIILDEPTSALDSLSEQKITEAMHNLFKDRTVLVIAHRLQTVKHADDIIVIEAGKIKERGTHAGLVRKKWFYKQMLDLQSW
jgi:ATP-binding cassette subfamily B protein